MKSAYVCEYCGKVGDYNAIEEHEQGCNYNPHNKNCFTCGKAIFTATHVECEEGIFIPSTNFKPMYNIGVKTCCNKWEEGKPTKVTAM